MNQPDDTAGAAMPGDADGAHAQGQTAPQSAAQVRRGKPKRQVQVRVRWTFAEGEGLFTVLEPLSDEARRAELEFLIRLGHAVRSGTFAPFAAGAAGVSPALAPAPAVAAVPAPAPLHSEVDPKVAAMMDGMDVGAFFGGPPPRTQH